MLTVLPAAADYQAGVDAYQRRDFKTAFDEFMAAAQAGDPVAQNALGALYNHGLGVDVDNAQAAFWYQKAADQNYPMAMRNLATLYTNGHGVPFDLTQAKIWFAKAAELGDTEAARRLAALQPLGTAGTEAAPVTSFPAAPAPANPIPAPAPAVVQPAAMSPAAPVAGNWLLGQWQGPSLGCPPGGGVEFGPSQVLTYFNGQVAVILAASYRVEGDRITVTTAGSDGVGQDYAYRQTSPDEMTIVGIPETMPQSLLGAVHRRCGAAPATQQAAAPEPAPIPAQEPQPLVSPLANLPPEAPAPAADAAVAAPAPAPAESAPATTAPATAPATATATAATTPVPDGATSKDGWDAFERGDYQGALNVWKSLAQRGDPNMAVLTGTIYDFGQGVPQDDAEALKWYLSAAEAGNGNGQYRAASIYARSRQVPPDYMQAYKWLTVAMKTLPQAVSTNTDELTSIQAETLRSEVAGLMSTAEIGQAEAEAKNFKPTKP